MRSYAQPSWNPINIHRTCPNIASHRKEAHLTTCPFQKGVQAAKHRVPGQTGQATDRLAYKIRRKHNFDASAHCMSWAQPPAHSDCLRCASTNAHTNSQQIPEAQVPKTQTRVPNKPFNICSAVYRCKMELILVRYKGTLITTHSASRSSCIILKMDFVSACKACRFQLNRPEIPNP